MVQFLKSLAWGMLVIGLTQTATADIKVLELAKKRDGTMGMSYSLPYTAGTHTGAAKKADSEIKIDTESREVLSAIVRLPIRSLVSDNPKRDCHMREALGLDYSASDFPERHVCDSRYETPPSGRNSIEYPAIEFEVKQVVSPGDGRTDSVIQGVLSIHGISKEVEFPAKISVNSRKARASLKADFEVVLADYDIKVKPFLLIRVGKIATVHLDLNFEEKR